MRLETGNIFVLRKMIFENQDAEAPQKLKKLSHDLENSYLRLETALFSLPMDFDGIFADSFGIVISFISGAKSIREQTGSEKFPRELLRTF